MSELDPESNEEKEIDQVTIDVSCFIFPLAGETYEWKLEQLKSEKLDYLQIKITTSNGLLSEFHRKKLNPL